MQRILRLFEGHLHMPVQRVGITVAVCVAVCVAVMRVAVMRVAVSVAVLLVSMVPMVVLHPLRWLHLLHRLPLRMGLGK